MESEVSVAGVERGGSDGHFVDEDCERPVVGRGAVGQVVQHFRAHVLGCACQFLGVEALTGQSEICQFQLSFPRN